MNILNHMVTFRLPDALSKRQTNILLFVMLALVAFIYIPVFQNQLTNWDDELYIGSNPYLKRFTAENLRNIFTAYYAGNYHPLTLVSLALNFRMSGVAPWSYQLTNLLLHLANTWLVYVFIKRLLRTRYPGHTQDTLIPFVTAILFGIHTFQVESVAWMSERKNVLYAFFFLLSMIQYLHYLDKKTLKNYLLSLFLFLLSLLSKGMAVPLSLCIIGIDYVAERKLRSGKVIWEKIPFLALSLVFGYVAIVAQRSGNAIRTENHFLWFNQIAIAGYGFTQYLVKLCFPNHLSAFYPYPVKAGAFLAIKFYAYLFLVCSLPVVWWKYARHHRILVFGALFFMANISIVIQLLPVGDAVMADRYVYIPSIGFFLIVGFYAATLWQRSIAGRNVVIFVLVIYCSILGVKTYHRVGIWKDSMTLWTDALKNYPENNDRACQNLGNVWFDKGNYDEALANYNRILQLREPNNKAFGKAYIGKARIKQAQRDFQGAMEDFNTSLLYQPSYDAYLDRAVLKIELSDLPGAMNDLDRAIQLDPLSAGPYINKGGIFYQTGNYEEALKNFDRVLQLDPQNSKAYIGKGQVKQALNDMNGALSDFNTALVYKKSYEGFLNRAVLKIELKDYAGARADLDEASHIDSLSAELYINKGVVWLNSGKKEQALREFDRAVKMDTTSSLVFLYRAMAKSSLSDYSGAITDLNSSIRLQPSAEAYYYRGMANKNLGRKTNACSDLHQSAVMGNAVAKTELEQECK